MAVRDAIGFNYNGDPTQRVVYTESHDEVANGRARVPEEIDPGNATSYYAKKRSTLAAGVVFSTPGIPMIFQGQEFLEDEYFRDEVPTRLGTSRDVLGYQGPLRTSDRTSKKSHPDPARVSKASD